MPENNPPSAGESFTGVSQRPAEPHEETIKNLLDAAKSLPPGEQESLIRKLLTTPDPSPQAT